MANRNPQMSLKQATPIQGSFTPIVYTPQTEDLSLLQRSLAQLEARQTSAAEQQAKFNETAAKLQALVNPEEKQWVYDYINKQSAGFKNSIESGDYGAALRQATVAGSNLLSTPEAIGRIRAQEEYQQEVKTQQARRDRKEISQNTYDWWMTNNPYKYEDTYDKNGNIIGGSSFVAESRPVTDINWAAQAQAAFQMISPYKRSITKNPSSLGDVTNVENSKLDGYSHATQRINKQDIIDNIEFLLASTPDGYRQAEQAFDVATFEIEKMKERYKELIAKDPNNNETKTLGQKLELRRKFMYNNGSPIDYKEYYARMVTDNLYADKLAYDWHTDVETPVIKGNIAQPNTQRIQSESPTPYPGAVYNYETGLWHSPNVRQQIDTEGAQQGVGGATSGITNRFGG